MNLSYFELRTVHFQVKGYQDETVMNSSQKYRAFMTIDYRQDYMDEQAVLALNFDSFS